MTLIDFLSLAAGGCYCAGAVAASFIAARTPIRELEIAVVDGSVF
jgi:hypothetical protein